MKNLVLFDVDGTIAESGQKINDEISILINKLKNIGYEIGIVGGGKMEKILEQLDENISCHHYFSECGCVYFKSIMNDDKEKKYELSEIYRKNIRNHITYNKINILIKSALKYLSDVDYIITGNFIDLRNGIIYISLIGLVANQEERAIFMNLDKKYNYRKTLLRILIEKSIELNINNSIDIVEGGSVGIAIYPKEYDKVQVLNYFSEDLYNKIYYFGDKHEPNGNDYNIINHERVIGMRVDSLGDTVELLNKIINNKI
jgi:phosphomannomutase